MYTAGNQSYITIQKNNRRMMQYVETKMRKANAQKKTL